MENKFNLTREQNIFIAKRNIVDIEFSQNKLKVDINLKKGMLDDPLNVAKDITEVGH